MSKEKIALRRAIAMAYSVQDEIDQVRRGQGVRAEMMVPVGVVGHDDQYRSSIYYDIGLANKLLDYFGYKRGADGYRTLPNGNPLRLKISTQPDATSKIYDEIWKRGMDKIGVRVEFLVSNFVENIKAATQCKLMIWSSAWQADFPDGENFLQLFYGPNAEKGNHSCYQSAAYDTLYQQALTMPPGPEKNKLYLQMNQMIEGDTPVATHTSRMRNWLVRPWVQGFKRHPILNADWQYLDIEKHGLY